MSGILKSMYLDRRTTMKNILLGVIATCLILITGKMYLGNMQTAQAEVSYSDIQSIVYAICFTSGDFASTHRKCFEKSMSH